MKAKLKIAGLVAAGLVILMGILPSFMGLDRFRPKLESELAKALGRSVSLGDLSVSLLGRSVTIGDITIGDDPAFGHEPFVRAKALKVGVKLIPLIFSQAVEVTHISLRQPEVSLLRDEQGRWNFSSLANRPPASPKEDVETSSGPGLSFDALEIGDGRILVGRPRAPEEARAYEEVNLVVRDFSLSSRFPAELSAKLPGGGAVELKAEAGPVDRADTAKTPLRAELHLLRLDLAASGIQDAGSGLAGLLDFDGTLEADGRTIRTEGAVRIDAIKLVARGAPASRPVEAKYSAVYDLTARSGSVTRGDFSFGKALTTVTGTYRAEGGSRQLKLALRADRMPVDDLAHLLPALGVTLPSGSSLRGGSLSADFSIVGPMERPVVAGPILLSSTTLVGFDLGAKLSAISALSGAHTGPNTEIETLSARLRASTEGLRAEKLQLVIKGFGAVAGGGLMSEDGALNFKLRARLAGGGGQSLTQFFGGHEGIAFFVRGTASDPSFVPDVGNMVEHGVGNVLQGLLRGRR